MKTVLITGNKGFIGSNLIPELEGKYYLYTCDKKDDDDIFSSTFEYLVEKSDIVIHLAAQVSVNKSFKNPGQTFYTNAIGTARVVELCVKYKKKLIFPSSAAIYHPDLSPYARSKELAEDIVWSVRDLIPVVILRFFNVFGKGMNPDSGSVMYNFLTSKKLIVYGDGEQTRDFIHIRDVVKVIKEAIKPTWNGKVVDVGTGKAYSTNYVAGLFAHFRNKKVHYQPPRREIKWSTADTTILNILYEKGLTTNLEKDIKALCKMI